VTERDAAIETAGFVVRNTDSGPNLVRVTEPMPKEKRAEVSCTLTDAERGALSVAAAVLQWHPDGHAKTIRALLERTK